MLTPWPYHFSPASQAQGTPPDLGKNLLCTSCRSMPTIKTWRPKNSHRPPKHQREFSAKSARNERKFHPSAPNIINKTDKISSLKNSLQYYREKSLFMEPRRPRLGLEKFAVRQAKICIFKPASIPEIIRMGIMKVFNTVNLV